METLYTVLIGTSDSEWSYGPYSKERAHEMVESIYDQILEEELFITIGPSVYIKSDEITSVMAVPAHDPTDDYEEEED